MGPREGFDTTQVALTTGNGGRTALKSESWAGIKQPDNPKDARASDVTLFWDSQLIEENVP